MGCLEDRRRQESHGGDHATPGQTPLSCSPGLLQPRQLSTRQQMQQGQNWDKMVSYHPKKIERDIFSVLSFTAPHITGSVQID